MHVVRYLGYGVFFVFSFLIGIYLTFPWSAVKDRVLETVAKQAKLDIEADSLEPSWLTGAKITGLKIKSAPGEEPLTIPEITARAHVFSFLTGGWGVTIDLPIAQGEVDADLDGDADVVKVESQVKNVELSLIPGLQGAIGLPLSGKLSASTDLKLGLKEANKTEGTLTLKCVGLEILKGGKILGFPVPELAIGDFDWKIPIQKGKAKFDKQTVKGDNLELVLDGEMVVLNPIARSTVNMSLSFKPTDTFLKKEPLLNALLMNIQNAKGSDGFYTYALMGSIKGPRFTPRKKS